MKYNYIKSNLQESTKEKPNEKGIVILFKKYNNIISRSRIMMKIRMRLKSG